MRSKEQALKITSITKYDRTKKRSTRLKVLSV